VSLFALLLLASGLRAGDYIYETNNNTINLIAYTGKGGAVSIPATLDGLPVTSVGNGAFYHCTTLTGVTVPGSVTSIGDSAFVNCVNLTGVSLQGRVMNIGNGAFHLCTNLTRIVIPGSVTRLGDAAFFDCSNLTNIVVPKNVTRLGYAMFEGCHRLTEVSLPPGLTNIGDLAFYDCRSLAAVTIPAAVGALGANAFYACSNLTQVYFLGNAPVLGTNVFGSNPKLKIYYPPGTSGWGDTFAGYPTVLWDPRVQTGDGQFGVRTNRFGFNITGSTNLVVVVKACTNLNLPAWAAISTNALTNGISYFSDPQWQNYPGRFYCLRAL